MMLAVFTTFYKVPGSLQTEFQKSRPEFCSGSGGKLLNPWGQILQGKYLQKARLIVRMDKSKSPQHYPQQPPCCICKTNAPLSSSLLYLQKECRDENKCVQREQLLTLVIHKPSAELLKRSSVAHGP